MVRYHHSSEKWKGCECSDEVIEVPRECSMGKRNAIALNRILLALPLQSEAKGGNLWNTSA